MYNYRFTYNPILDKHGQPHVAELGHLDDARFIAQSPYEYLTADYIAALSGTDAKSITHRYNILKREPNRWIDIAAPQLENQKSYRNDFLAYSLNPKTIQRLEHQGNELHSYGCSGPFVHKLMTSWIRASFDIATRVEKVPARIIPWNEILASPNCPDATKKPVKGLPAYALKVSFTYDGEHITQRVFPDCHPFAIQANDEYAIVFLETD